LGSTTAGGRYGAQYHIYERSRQIQLNLACPAVDPQGYNPRCIADNGSDGRYRKGRGTVQITAGTVRGDREENIDPKDAHVPYFSKTDAESIFHARHRDPDGTGRELGGHVRKAVRPFRDRCAV